MEHLILNLEDLFVTGFVAEELGVRRKSVRNFYNHRFTQLPVSVLSLYSIPSEKYFVSEIDSQSNFPLAGERLHIRTRSAESRDHAKRDAENLERYTKPGYRVLAAKADSVPPSMCQRHLN